MIGKWITLLIFLSLGSVEKEVALMNHFKEESLMMSSVSTYIYRMEADVTGDGHREIFLGHSQSSGQIGVEWHIYSPRSEDGRLVFMGRLVCHSGGFGYDVENSEIVVTARDTAFSGRIIYYKMIANRIHEVRRTDLLGWEDPEDKKKGEIITKWQKSTAIEVLYATVEEYGSLKSLEWRELKTQELRKSARSLDDLVVVESEDDSLK